ncbi:ABC transporter permease [Bacillus kwashiorkori]|uniref:ABC transporter permease n=1 Tax=Bacillus kwashiorkori TaxID=1522318 RepID=UPI000AE2FD8B|nr:FtsX-like permease family protein [Bacillus kwashiorkori]
MIRVRLALKRIKHRKLYTITTILAMVCIFVIVPLGIHFSQESKLSVEMTIEEYGRGSYDILVRPSESRTNIEKELGVVEENYIGDSFGGISLAEWSEIKANPDIEIAAPVASLGYFAGNGTSVGLPHLDYPARFTWQFLTSDGIHYYPLGEENTATYFEYYKGEHGEWVEYFTDNWDAVVRMSPWMPENYYLLVAVDVESENKLTGIDFSDLNKPIDEAPDADALKHWLIDRGNPPMIPVLQRSDLSIPLYLSLNVDKLEVSLSEYKTKYGVRPEDPIYFVEENDFETLENELNSEPAASTNKYFIDLSTSQQPFNGNYVTITNNFQVEAGQGGSLQNDTGIYYTASKIDYKLSNDTIRVKKVEDGEPPLYKKVTEHGFSYLDTHDYSAPFIIWQMGTFSVPLEEKLLTSSPLGIYAPEEVITSDGTPLTTTTNPGSFISAPAAGVTTIEAAEIIKGDKPIDAIRIRVAGIESYNAEGQKKIERVAKDLLSKGYEVDIVAGSSFKKLEMDVEGIGLVTSSWTTLGIAQSLTTSWNSTALINTVLFAFFGVAWFASRILYERNALTEENQLLHMIGWHQKHIRLKNSFEQMMLLTTAIIVSVLFLSFLNLQVHQYIYIFPIILWVFTIIFVQIIFANKKTSAKRVIGYKKWASIFHYRHLIIPVMIVLITSVVLVGIQVTTIIQSIFEARETTLGEFAINQSLYLNILVLGATLFLTFISVSEAMNAIFHTRKREFQMYHTIGWTKKMIRTHLVKEVLVWAGIACVSGTILSLLFLFMMDFSLKWMLLICVSSIVLLLFPLAQTLNVKKYMKV